MVLLNARLSLILCTALFCLTPALTLAQPIPVLPPVQSLSAAPDLDLTIKYFNRELTPEGVLHENSYTEKMLRRNGHVWTWRILPRTAENNATHANHEHKEFNYIVLPRHVSFDGKSITVEFINKHDRQVIYIAPTEYENINFDGSWPNAFYLINPKAIAAMPVSRRASPVAHARWHEVEKNGLFQRVLWDDKSAIPLIFETGDQAGTFMQRLQVQVHAKRVQDLPWQHLQGYTQKEYSDFLD